jgi:putative ABC transport system permease protein
VRAYDLIELSARNLREAGLRNSLTTLGIAVGVASLVAMSSLGIGLQRLATRQLGRSGLFDTVIVTSRQDGRGPRFAQAAPVVAQPKPLDDAARHSFEQMANVAEVYPNFSAVGDVRMDTAKVTVTLPWLESCPSRREAVRPLTKCKAPSSPRPMLRK